MLVPAIPKLEMGGKSRFLTFSNPDIGCSTAPVLRLHHWLFGKHALVDEITPLRHCDTMNVIEVPGFRIENSPFGGIKDSGLGIKEGVIEAMKCMTTVKTFSLP